MRGVKPATKVCRYTVWPFTETVASEILDHIVKGKTVEDVGKMKGYPPARIIRYWQKHNPQFRKDMTEARRERAEYFEDKIIEIAMKTKKKSEVFVNKLKIDTLKWTAQIGDPAQYGPKQIVEGNPDRPIQIIVDTGIRRIDDDRRDPGLTSGNKLIDKFIAGQEIEIGTKDIVVTGTTLPDGDRDRQSEDEVKSDVGTHTLPEFAYPRTEVEGAA